MDLKGTGLEDVEWINLAENKEDWWAFVYTAIKILVA
jgi:hypothetical protein